MDTERKIALGRAIKAARIVKGMDQETFAERMKVTKYVVRSWEQGRTEPSALRLGRIAAELGVTADSLLYGACGIGS